MMNMMDGGISGSISDAATTSAAANSGRYPAVRIAWTVMMPRPAMVASAEPEMPPNTIAASTATCARPPEKYPTTTSRKLKMRRVIPNWFIMLPASTKNGMASSGTERTSVAM